MAMNSLGIGKRYLKFYVDNIDSRYVISIGGRRSGKSFATAKWLRFLASGKPIKILVIAATFPAIQLVIEDFQNATGLTVTGSMIYGYSCKLKNGSIFQFRAFPGSQRVQGTTGDIIWFEEFLNIPEEVIRVATMSCTGQIYFTANPTRKSKLLDDYVNKDGLNFLRTTYKDNPFLTQEQRKEFEDIKLRSQQPNATLYDIFCAKVYCDGEFGDLVGRCFEKLEYCTYNDYWDVPSEEAIFMDLAFGGADKTAICGFKLYNKKLYVHTYQYKQGTINAKELAWDLVDCGFNAYTTIFADYGGVGRQILDSLITAQQNDEIWTEPELCQGFSIANVLKGRVLESIMALMALDAIVIDDSNYNTREEFENAQLDENQKPKGENDHTIACARYAINYFHAIGK